MNLVNHNAHSIHAILSPCFSTTEEISYEVSSKTSGVDMVQLIVGSTDINGWSMADLYKLMYWYLFGFCNVEEIIINYKLIVYKPLLKTINGKVNIFCYLITLYKPIVLSGIFTLKIIRRGHKSSYNLCLVHVLK